MSLTFIVMTYDVLCVECSFPAFEYLPKMYFKILANNAITQYGVAKSKRNKIRIWHLRMILRLIT